MNVIITDGGRAAAGFKGKASGDCVCRAVAVAAEMPYREVYDLVIDIVSEGVAPYAGGFAGQASALVRSRQAVRVLETRFTLGLASAGDPCGLGAQHGQEGGSPMGENFNPCVNVTAGAGGTLAGVFGGAGAGALTSTGLE